MTFDQYLASAQLLCSAGIFTVLLLAIRALRHSLPVRPAGTRLWETLRRAEDGTWCHVGHVREGTPAWHDYHSTPGLALRTPDGKLHEGVQE